MSKDQSTDYQHWFEQNYWKMSAHGMWARGGELNTLPRSEFESRDYRVMFVRLSTYFDTGYSFTHQFLYQVAAGTLGVYPNLAYLPPKSDQKLFSQHSIPWLLGTQSKKSAEDFDLIAFSNSIVQELINLPSFLAHSQIPFSKSERMMRPEIPLLIMGGANALYSSSIWGSDPLVDGIFVGESDLAIRRILEICKEGKKIGKSKTDILFELESVPGFFQPDKPRKTKKSFIPNLNQSEALEKGPVYYIDDQLGNSHLQISEGCPCFCSFCAESWDRKPYRERSSDILLETALRAKASMGLDQVDIYSFNFNMHSGLYKIIWDLVGPFRHIGLKSQRFDLLSHDPAMVDFQHAIEKASFTCGLEGISPRIRKYLHKNLENEHLHKSLTAIFRSKARELKVFLIATGLEEEQDLVALDDLLDHLKEIQQQTHSNARIIFSMTPLVRFPWTPLEFEDGFEVEHYEKIIKKTAMRIKNRGFEFRESADLPEYWVSQILARAADPKITKALLEAIANTGFVYNREISNSFMEAFNESLRANDLDPSVLIRGYNLEESNQKPWAWIDTGVKREFLWEEVERARVYKEIDYCLGRNWTKAKCFHCGGCPTRFHVRDIVLSEQKRDYTLDQFKLRIKTARDNDTSISFPIQVGKKGIGVYRKLLGVALARALMLTDRTLTPFYRGYVGSKFNWDGEASWVSGDEVLTLKFQKAALPILNKIFSNPELLQKVNAYADQWLIVSAMVDVSDAPISFMKFHSPLKPSFDPYLKSLGLKYTMKKGPQGEFLFEFTKDSVKKGYFKNLSYTKKENYWVGMIEMGVKLNQKEMLQKSFQENGNGSWVLTQLKASVNPLTIEALHSEDLTMSSDLQ